jgi:hypothetical protein
MVVRIVTTAAAGLQRDVVVEIPDRRIQHALNFGWVFGWILLLLGKGDRGGRENDHQDSGTLSPTSKHTTSRRGIYAAWVIAAIRPDWVLGEQGPPFRLTLAR